MRETIKIRFLNKHNTESNEFRRHSHDCYEIVYFLSGSGKTIIGEKSYPVSEHSYCIVAPHSKHIECMDGYGEILFIGFELDPSALQLKEGVYRSHDRSCLSQFQRIFEEYREQSLGYELAAQSLLSLLLVGAVRETSTENKGCKDLDYIRSYIEQHSDQKINFRELSVLSGYSYDYFRHTFRQKFHVSPQEYLIDIRLKNAMKLLKTSDRSCTEIAYQCGFSNASQLSSMFCKKYGFPPTAARTADSFK